MPTLWQGVLPAITTPFLEDGSIDLAFLARHASWMIDHGCTGIVALGSLGEGGTLDQTERAAVLKTLVDAVGARVPVIAAVAALSTREAERQAGEAAAIGCRGLMILPPYVYKGSANESLAHVSAVIRATDLSCMLYNNPIAYGIDFTPEQVAALAEAHPNLDAVKESSADVRRITAVRALIDDRLAVCVGVDDLIVEGVAAGATGWVAGLVNAFPAESVAIFDFARASDHANAERLYRWFLPMLRMDVVPEFVHLIKLAQVEVGMGSARVRPPRLPLPEVFRRQAECTIQQALLNRPRKA